jgi:hypothetical protein
VDDGINSQRDLDPKPTATIVHIEIREESSINAQGSYEQLSPGGLLPFQNTGTPTAEDPISSPTQLSLASSTASSDLSSSDPESLMQQLAKQTWFPAAHFFVWVYVFSSALALVWLWSVGVIDTRLNVSAYLSDRIFTSLTDLAASISTRTSS